MKVDTIQPTPSSHHKRYRISRSPAEVSAATQVNKIIMSISAAALASVNVNADEDNTRSILSRLPPAGKPDSAFVLSEEDYRIIALWRKGVQRDCIRKRRKRKPKVCSCLSSCVSGGDL